MITPGQFSISSELSMDNTTWSTETDVVENSREGPTQPFNLAIGSIASDDVTMEFWFICLF